MVFSDSDITKKDSLSKSRKMADILSAQERNKKKICHKVREKFTRRNDATQEVKEINSREQMIMHYAYLVNWVVGRLPIASLKGLEKDDLIGYGTVGLIEAIDRFDETRNTSFESFAIARVRGSIYDQLRAQDHLTRGSRKKVKNLSKITSELERKLGRCPTDGEIAKELSISLDELRAIQQESQIGIFSLDETRDDSEESMSLSEMVPSNNIDILNEIEENEMKELLIKAIDHLPTREKTIIGLYHYKKLTFKEIAEIMDFSESRASQLHARAISLLKSKLVKE